MGKAIGIADDEVFKDVFRRQVGRKILTRSLFGNEGLLCFGCCSPVSRKKILFFICQVRTNLYIKGHGPIELTFKECLNRLFIIIYDPLFGEIIHYVKEQRIFCKGTRNGLRKPFFASRNLRNGLIPI